MAIETIDNFNIFVGRNIDNRYGPYANESEANLAINSIFRFEGLTVLLTGSGNQIEYWYYNGITDPDLIPKGAAISITGSNGQVVFFSGSSAISGSPSFTFDYTSSTPIFNVSGAISASYGPNTVGFYGTASWAENALTASFVTASNVWGPFGSSSVLSASYALHGGDITQIIAGTNITVSPPEGTGSVTINSTAAAGSGLAVAATASFTNLSVWDFTHNLNSRYVIIQALDTNHQQIIPETIELLDTASARLTFPTLESGYAIASVGGITASLALTASSVLTNNGGAIYGSGANLIIDPVNDLIISGNIIPGPPYVNNKSSFNLGSPTALWNHLYAGSATLTGSLSITGSTTQIGNNTLQGNTLLSGSIIISGSQPPGSPTASVRVYGDIETYGYHRFDPVTTNIDTSISASYIYVSGSTQDLYFSQNGSGYNNVTRLRWLESTLGTGLLKGGNITSAIGSNVFTVAAGEGIVVKLNASLTQDPYPVIKLVSWPTQTLPIIYSSSVKITYVGIDNTGTVIQQTEPWGATDIDQWDSSIDLGVVLTLSGSVSTGVYNSPQISYGPQQKTDDFFRAFGPLKVSGHTLRASGSTLGLIKDAGTAYREGSNYITNPNHPSTTIENNVTGSKIYRYYTSGSTPVIDTGVGSAGYTTIDPTQRVNTATGLLTSVSTNKYSLQRVFWFPKSPTQAFIVYYGNAQYDSLIDAINAKDSEPFTEAPNTALNAIFLGYIAVAGGATNLANATDATILQGGIFRSVGGVGSSGTNFVSTTLAGLADVSIDPNPPAKGDLLVYGAAGDSQWNNSKQLTGSYGLTGSLTMQGNIIPAGPYTNNTSSYDLGSPTAAWRDLYVSNGSIKMISGSNSASIQFNGGVVTFSGALVTLPASSTVPTASYVTPYEGAWISYTPSWTAASANPSIGNGSLQGWYKVVGKTCFVRGNIVMGSTTTFGSGEWYVSMPFTASHADAILMTANLLDNGSAWYNATVNGARAGFNYKAPLQYQGGAGTALDINATQPFTWTNSDRFLWNGSYEIA